MISNVKPIQLTASNQIKVNSDGGYIQVTNYGLFLAYFSVFYRYNGKDYYKESPIFSMFLSETITFPKGATDIDFTVYVGVYYQIWNVIYFKTFKTPPLKCYSLAGISLYATCKESPCDYVGSNGTPNYNNCNCCNWYNWCNYCNWCNCYKWYNHYE